MWYFNSTNKTKGTESSLLNIQDGLEQHKTKCLRPRNFGLDLSKIFTIFIH